MDFLIGILIGLCVGVLCSYIFVKIKKSKRKPSGVFVMDFSDPLKDVCRLELSEDLNSIYTKKSIILNIQTVDSQE